MPRVVLSIILAAAAYLGAGGWSGAAGDERAMMLRVENPGALQSVIAGFESAATPDIPTAAITDLLIEIRPRVETPRRTAYIAPGEQLRTFIDARLLVVTGGRIDPGGQATCDSFDGDILVCRLGCEGGAFGLRRRGGGRHDLIVGMRAPQLTAVRGLGFRLGACASRTGGRMVVMPGGGRLAVSVPLVETP